MVRWSTTLSRPVRWATNTRRSEATATSTGSVRPLAASGVRWKEPVRVAVQSPGFAPAAHSMPPSRWDRKAPSRKSWAAPPPAVNHERPPS